MKIVCSECGEKFERTGGRSQLCLKCWSAARIRAGTNSRASYRVICSRCGEELMPDDDRVTIDSSRRMKNIINAKFPKAWKQNRIAVFHKRCFKLGDLLR